jgi:glutathionylspermidine synthase
LAQRISLPVRPDWREKVEARGLTWHTGADGTPYWDESAYWLFSEAEIDRIEAATTTLYDMCLEAVGHVIDQKQLPSFGYDPTTVALIEQSWSRRSWQPTLYARFDLAYDGQNIKLLELNGDTPTSLVEAAVVQWWWLEERFPDGDQYNSIHEKLVAALDLYRKSAGAAEMLHLTCVTPHLEDQGTIDYIAAAAADAGVETRFVALGDIGLRSAGGVEQFVDLADEPIEFLFKLVPWEWLLADPFGQALARETAAERIRLIEPAWKMAASNKLLLVTLKDLFPDSEYLLDATTSAEVAAGYGDYVSKPVRGREGANVTLVEAGRTVAATPGAYDDDLFVYQRRAELMQADGAYAVLGSWVVNRQACGLGVRESSGPITNNFARFVPHVMSG